LVPDAPHELVEPIGLQVPHVVGGFADRRLQGRLDRVMGTRGVPEPQFVGDLLIGGTRATKRKRLAPAICGLWVDYSSHAYSPMPAARIGGEGGGHLGWLSVLAIGGGSLGSITSNSMGLGMKSSAPASVASERTSWPLVPRQTI